MEENSQLDVVARSLLTAWTDNPRGNDEDQSALDIVNDCLSHARNEYPEIDAEIEEAGGVEAVCERMLWILAKEWGIYDND